MPVPSSGTLRLRANIALEVDGSASGTNVRLGTLSDTAGFSAPDAMSDFYGFSAVSTQLQITDPSTFSIGGGDGTSYAQRITASGSISDVTREMELSIFEPAGQTLRIDLYRQYTSNTSARVIDDYNGVTTYLQQSSNVSLDITLPSSDDEIFIFLISTEDDGSTRSFNWSIYLV